MEEVASCAILCLLLFTSMTDSHGDRACASSRVLLKSCHNLQASTESFHHVRQQSMAYMQDLAGVNADNACTANRNHSANKCVCRETLTVHTSPNEPFLIHTRFHPMAKQPAAVAAPLADNEGAGLPCAPARHLSSIAICHGSHILISS